MNRVLRSALLVAIILPCTLAAAQHSGQPTGQPTRQCLTDEAREINKKLKALNRPTTKDDPLPIFDPDYFIGSWMLEWEAPESPLGQSGTLTGTATFRHVGGCYYEGEFSGKGPDGAWKSKIQLVYDPANKYMVWIENDSRGFTIIKPGPVGGDSGGYFTHYWETPVIKYKGKSVNLKGSTFFAAQVNYRLRTSISVDGEPYVNFGNPWFRRQGVPATAVR